MCVMKGSDEEKCQNYVRILAKTGNNNLLVCATNAFKPMCRDYIVQAGNYSVENEKPAQARCPYDPQHNSTFVYVNGELYTGTVADFSGMDPIIYREPLQTEQYDSMSLNGKDQLSMFQHMGKSLGPFAFELQLKKKFVHSFDIYGIILIIFKFIFD